MEMDNNEGTFRRQRLERKVADAKFDQAKKAAAAQKKKADEAAKTKEREQARTEVFHLWLDAEYGPEYKYLYAMYRTIDAFEYIETFEVIHRPSVTSCEKYVDACKNELALRKRHDEDGTFRCSMPQEDKQNKERLKLLRKELESAQKKLESAQKKRNEARATNTKKYNEEKAKFEQLKKKYPKLAKKYADLERRLHLQ